MDRQSFRRSTTTADGDRGWECDVDDALHEPGRGKSRAPPTPSCRRRRQRRAAGTASRTRRIRRNVAESRAGRSWGSIDVFGAADIARAIEQWMCHDEDAGTPCSRGFGRSLRSLQWTRCPTQKTCVWRLCRTCGVPAAACARALGRVWEFVALDRKECFGIALAEAARYVADGYNQSQAIAV